MDESSYVVLRTAACGLGDRLGTGQTVARGVREGPRARHHRAGDVKAGLPTSPSSARPERDGLGRGAYLGEGSMEQQE